MPQKKKTTAQRSPKTAKATSPSQKAAPKAAAPAAPQRRLPEDRAIHIIMPYVLWIVALFFALCFILGEARLGLLGYVSVFLKGLFSYGAFFLPAYLCIHAAFYKRDLSAGSHLYKFWFTFGNLSFIGVFSSIFQKTAPTFKVDQNYVNGISLVGGGAIGGTFHALLQRIVGIFTPVIGIIAIVLFTSFLFGKTPGELIRAVFLPMGERMRQNRDERHDRQAAVRRVREEERTRMAEEKEREKFTVKRENAEEKKKKKAKCVVNMETGEVITEDAPEDLVPDDEVRIRLPLEEVEPEPEPVREIIPIEELESEPVPSLKDELKDLFADDAGRPELSKKELASDFLSAETDLTPPWEEEIIPPEAEKAPIPVPAPVMEEEEEEEPPKEPEYRFPPVSLLQAPPAQQKTGVSEQETTAKKLVETLASFGVKTSICGVAKGPAVTRYELQPQPGVRVRSIVNLTDDIALALAAGGVRIEAPIPGKEAVGIEVPNKARETVFVRELIDHKDFADASSKLCCSLGKDVAGKPIYCDLSKMPHILIAGATGMGKSVCLNSLIVSILYHATPEEVQMILIDPKKVEMGVYNRIPHLIVPVVSDSKKAAGALSWSVIEMEKRFVMMEEVGVRDIKSYNEITKNDPEKKYMPQIVIIIDELADLMMTARDEVETSICRLAQKARAAGMHLVIGTQRPSVDVITGLIKANVPSRIACTVASQVDSRTIIDIQGAEKLLGRGDMLYAPVGSPKPIRVQGAFVSESEIEAICDFIRGQREAHYDEAVSNAIEVEAQKCGDKKKGSSFFADDDGDSVTVGLFADKDPLLERAIDIAIEEKKISTSLLQRKLSVGYARAAKLVDFMAELHVVGDYAGSKPREVLWTKEYFTEYKMRALEETPIK